MGICGTARLIDAYSCRSGRSSQRKTGRGLEASSARARNDSLLIFLYNSRCSINLSDPLMFPTGPIKVLMDDAGSVSSSARVARWSWRGERRREAGCGSLSLGVCFQRAPVPDSRLSAPWPSWRTLKTLFNGPLVFSGPTPRSQISHSHTGLQRMRSWRAKRRERAKIKPLPHLLQSAPLQNTGVLENLTDLGKINDDGIIKSIQRRSFLND